MRSGPVGKRTHFGASSRAAGPPSTAQNIRCNTKFGRLTSLSILRVAGPADARRSRWSTGWCRRLQPRGGMPCWRPDLAVAKPDFGSPRTHILNTYTVVATGAAGSRRLAWRTGWCSRWQPRGVTPWRPPGSQTCCIPPRLAGPQVRCRAPVLLPWVGFGPWPSA